MAQRPGAGPVRPRTVDAEGWLTIRGGGRRLFDYHPETNRIRIQSRSRLFEIELNSLDPRPVGGHLVAAGEFSLLE